MGFFQIIGTLTLCLFYFCCFVDGSKCERKDSEMCKNVGSLKGLVYMMESVSSALADIISSTKYRAEKAEDDLCLSPKITDCLALSSDDNNGDHCVKAETDCKSLFYLGFKGSGRYRIWPTFLNHSLNVYCDMETDGGGWTVIQRRGDFSEPHISFYETWEAYKKGFGDIRKEFWLGNDAIFALTNEASTILRIDLEDFDGDKRFAKYKKFLVRSEIENYKLTIGEYEGDAGNSLGRYNGYEFSTKDKGNDRPSQFTGGWWYAQRQFKQYLPPRFIQANLNGIYLHGDHDTYADGINWFHFRGFNHSMKVSEMKIRKCDC